MWLKIVHKRLEPMEHEAEQLSSHGFLPLNVNELLCSLKASFKAREESNAP